MIFKPMHPALYRCTQFFAALQAYLPAWAGGLSRQLSLEDKALVKTILRTDPQQQLFARMSPNDQRHALAVVRTLQNAGQTHPALLQAALLHDVAKSLGQPLPHRVLIVLLEAFWPAALRVLAGEEGAQAWWDAPGEVGLTGSVWRWGRRPFTIHAHHPAMGAAWAEAAGCDPLAVSLIRRHQEKNSASRHELLAMLQWADDLN